jgi:diacylglycerol kinase (ATP)
MQNVLLFINPLFNQTRSQRATLDRVAATLKAAGIRVEILHSLSAQQSGDQAREAANAGFDTILVCGGDGTLFHVLQGVAGTSAVLGIIPLGTGNVVAQNLHLPRNPVDAARVLIATEPISIPLGRITCQRAGHRKPKSWYFVFAAGMGVHAALMNLAPDGAGKRIGGRAAYYLGGIKLLLQHAVQPFEVEVTTTEGSTLTYRVSEAIAVRVPEINVWRPGGDLQGSGLRLATVAPTTRTGLAHASFRALTASRSPSIHGNQPTAARSRGLPLAHYIDATRIVCRPIPDFDYHAPILVEADGEVLGETSATITLAEERVSILWPRLDISKI